MNETSTESIRTSPTLLIGVKDPQNHEAWETFIARYGPMIRGWCRHWFPRSADDKVYEVFSELVFCMIKFEYDPSKGRFRGWLKTVTHNLMAKLKREAFPQPGSEDDPFDSLEAKEDLAARLAAEFDLEEFERAKDVVRPRVEPKTWAAYLATAEEYRKAADVARELGMKLGTVFQAKHSVITQVRREIERLQGPA
jgi:RNA polymerase sigma-70 factor (ECF subfamily)